jgi:hypothetical protein
VVVTRWRTSYSKTTHRKKREGTSDPECTFVSAKLTLTPILLQCKETDEERRKSNMTKEERKKGEGEATMLVEYVKNIG